MFIIDFRNKLVSNNCFSIMGNNNVDVIHFYSHFTQYASGYNVYLKVIGDDETYVDKILIDSENISVEDGALLVKWTMGEVSTQCKKIDVQLQFENGDGSIIAQTRIVSITLGDTINVDEKIGHIYPKVLQLLQEQIDELKLEDVKSFTMSFSSDTLIINLYNKDQDLIATSQVSIPLSEKLSMVNEVNKVYGTNANGVNIRYPINSDIEAFAIPIRNIGGALRVPLTPNHNNDAISYSYFKEKIDEIEQRSDVVDVVGTYQDLEDYDTSHLAPNSLIKVINDETHDNEITYYRWVITGGVGAWVYVASEGAYYTTSQIDTMLSNLDKKTFNVINASDIVNDTLTQAQYDIISNGQPTIIKGEFGGSTNPIIFNGNTSATTVYRALLIGKEANGNSTMLRQFQVLLSNLTISFGGVPLYLESNGKVSVYVNNVNNKQFPQSYPTTNPLPMAFVINENGGAIEWSDAYNTLFNPTENSANTEIKWTKLLSFSKSADTTFTFETAKTNCLNEYKAIITNSGANAITITLPSGVLVETNDDNIVVSSNTFTLPSGTTIELNCVNNWCIVYNHSAQ